MEGWVGFIIDKTFFAVHALSLHCTKCIFFEETAADLKCCFVQMKLNHPIMELLNERGGNHSGCVTFLKKYWQGKKNFLLGMMYINVALESKEDRD